MAENGIILEQLTQKQARAVALLAMGTTQEQTCDSVKISPRQLARWMREPNFKTALDETRKQVIRLAFDKLNQAVGSAADRLVELVKSTTESISLRACELILRFCRENSEISDLVQRLDRIEKQIGQTANS